MLLKCKECGFENQLGAIFCRDCGVKLDVETMRPEVKEYKPKFAVGDLVKNLLAIAVLGALILMLVMMFYPEHGVSAELDAADIEKTDIKFQSLINKIAGEPEEDTYIFTPDEVTYLYNNKLTESGEGSGYKLEKMYFNIDKNDNIVILIDSTLMGIGVSFKVVGTIVDEQAELVIKSAKMGHLPIISFLHDKIIDNFTVNIDQGSIKDIIEATESLTIDEDGAFHIMVKSLKK